MTAVSTLSVFEELVLWKNLWAWITEIFLKNLNGQVIHASIRYKQVNISLAILRKCLSAVKYTLKDFHRNVT